MGLVIRDLVKRFGNLTALDAVSLDVPNGTFVCFLGPSGCGKTTLLRVIAGLEVADRGEVRLDERDLRAVPAKDRNFGMVFQSYSLFPNMSAARNVAYGLECRHWPAARITSRVQEMVELVHLAEHVHKYPEQLSGGQQQRIALARAIAPEPSLLLLDEPLSALDAKVREELRTEIRAVQRRLGITTIMVTHDQEEALTMADLIVVMHAGRIEQVGTPTELYEEPRTTFVAGFLGRMSLLDVLPAADGRATYAGATLRVAAAGAAGASRIGIRPEAVSLAAAPRAAENEIAGRVREVQYLGNLTRVTVEPDGLPEGLLLAELHGRAAIPTVGQPVWLELPATALKVLA